MKLHPLIESLADAHGRIACDTPLAGGEQVLFFAGDPVRFPEALDVAVALPELQRAHGRRFAIGVVERRDEDALARRWGVQRWPSLVFVRDGGWLDTVAGMRDWDEYLALAAQALARTPTRAPGVGIPVVVDGGDATACH
jgi:hydrogenase-1 operon protein HyaE